MEESVALGDVSNEWHTRSAEQVRGALSAVGLSPEDVNDSRSTAPTGCPKEPVFRWRGWDGNCATFSFMCC